MAYDITVHDIASAYTFYVQRISEHYLFQGSP